MFRVSGFGFDFVEPGFAPVRVPSFVLSPNPSSLYAIRFMLYSLCSLLSALLSSFSAFCPVLCALSFMLCASLLSYHFNQHPFFPFSVKLPVEDLFPGSEIKPPVCYCTNYLPAHNSSLDMRIGIVLESIMPVL